MRVLPFLFVLGCAGAAARMRDARARGSVSEAADIYWRAVRWGDTDRATLWLRTPEGRLAVSQQLEQPTRRITEARLVDVALVYEGDAVVGASASVRVESFDLRRGRVDNEVVQQWWIKDGPIWRIDEEKSPIDPDRPW